MRLRSSLWFLLAVMFLRSVASGITQLIVSIYIRSLGLSITELGVLAGGFGAGLLIFEPVWGVLSDRGLKKKFFVMSSFFTPVITFLYTVLGESGNFLPFGFLAGSFLAHLGCPREDW